MTTYIAHTIFTGTGCSEMRYEQKWYFFVRNRSNNILHGVHFVVMIIET